MKFGQITLQEGGGFGTFGYCDPLYVETGLLTKESDIYSFDVVLFEVLCGKLSIDRKKRKQPVSSSGPANNLGTAKMRNVTKTSHLGRLIRFVQVQARLFVAISLRVAVLWDTDSLKPKATLEEHSSRITDVRFSPSMSRLATSSIDKTVRVWDVDHPDFSLHTFIGHSASVMSLDFHPNRDDLICSCDRAGGIRYWSIQNGSYNRVFKGGTTQVRFQPCHGRFLAAAAKNIVSILDVETQACRHTLQGHLKPIQSICWDESGEYLASSLELWNMWENKTMTLSAHEGLISDLAVATSTGLVASASHDKIVKLWK
ncbi:hypothetical protein L1987_67751 [Smallanthus sonchifolius]|uniref:Uncharacterized protein n=1 Tax=Smallanthus sonchifolius TaxID=185202 RepID=A0ACB9B4K2_9ASTR|nr:hypothetical protein L1987_67751 [Smallanthus sonchifolius]